jgi:hypothetical protein
VGFLVCGLPLVISIGLLSFGNMVFQNHETRLVFRFMVFKGDLALSRQFAAGIKDGALGLSFNQSGHGPLDRAVIERQSDNAWPMASLRF